MKLSPHETPWWVEPRDGPWERPARYGMFDILFPCGLMPFDWDSKGDRRN